jgi:nucleotide-binding universal stress UspA family protein
MPGMTEDTRPAVVAFDGSAPAGAALRTAATLFTGRPLLVVSVWEQGLAYALTPMSDIAGIAYVPPPPEEVVSIDRSQRDHAVGVAEAGAQAARELGASAEALAVADEVDIAATIVGVAHEHDACAIVIGSRGLGRVKRLFGSTSRALLEQSERPVLVVRAPDADDD